MAEEQDLERTYPATPRRLEQARERGQVARSRELSTAAIAFAGALALATLGPALFGQCAQIMRAGLTLDRTAAFDADRMSVALSALAHGSLWAILPVLGVTLLATLAAPLLLSGWVFSGKAVTPDFHRLDPLRGLSNLISKHALVELVKALAKCALLAGLGAWSIAHAFDELTTLSVQDLGGATMRLGGLIATGFFALVGGLALIAALDVPYAIWRHRDALKMTREEVREEMRESEGDPAIKARVRSLQRAAARKRMMAAVPTATVVVTNPTHYAVALRYDETMRAPRIVAKGMDKVAQRIREIAAEHGVPLLEAPAVARALHRHGDLDAEIPHTLYAVIAQVLAYVYQVRAWRAQGGRPPVPPSDLAVPDGLDPLAAGAPA
ncbi:MAG TPA: flagellar biosynthesis protein FlhB [Casimicrobiaceae bacterium]|nr:flagellar biosynthesis protein FlhB [Casimicrobiaceae bacterium]